MNWASPEVKAGIVIVIAAALMVVALVVVGNLTEELGKEYINLALYYNNVSGLKGGAKVSFAGREVGEVISIELVNPKDNGFGKKVKVMVKVDKVIHTKHMRRTYRASVVTRIFGEPSIDLDAWGDDPLTATDLDGTDPTNITEVIRNLSGKADSILANVDRAVVQLNRYLTPAKLGRIVDNVEGITTKLEAAAGSLSRTLDDVQGLIRKEKGRVGQIVADIRGATRPLPQLSRDLKQRVDGLLAKLDGTVATLKGFLERAEPRIFELVAALKKTSGSLTGILDASQPAVRKVLEGLAKVTGNLEKGSGTLDGVLKDVRGLVRGGRLDLASAFTDLGRAAKRLRNITEGFRWTYLYYAFNKSEEIKLDSFHIYQAARSFNQGIASVQASIARIDRILATSGGSLTPGERKALQATLEDLTGRLKTYRRAESLFWKHLNRR